MDYLKLLAYTASFLGVLALLFALAFYENKQEP